MPQITEKTLLPLSLVITFLGGVSWLTSIDNKATASANDLFVQRQTIEKMRDDSVGMREQLATIKAIVTEISNRQGRMADYLQKKLK